MSKSRYVLQVHVGAFSNLYEALSIEASKQTTASDIVACIAEKLGLSLPRDLELAEVVHNASGEERHLGPEEFPVALQLLWPQQDTHRFCLRERLSGSSAALVLPLGPDASADAQLLRDYFLRFLYHQPRDRDYSDLCQLPDLTEQTLLENLKARFERGHIYTYVGSILIAVNPFKFYPIYNPKYVGLYQNQRLGDLPPHIFAVADAAYHAMLRSRASQCVVISGESGSGKTESTNLLLHHLTALSQKGSYGRGVEQTILSAGPVLEAFGNAKTKHNNNSSRFGKFIQVNYRENGMVHGALVQKYLLEKSRIVSQAKKERNYHVFYYLLAGASDEERRELHLSRPEDYHYLNQSQCYTLEGTDEAFEYTRLMQSMEMVGFNLDKRKRLIRVLSAVLHLGNIEFSKSTYHSDEAVQVKNPEVLSLISSLLGVKEETLNSALTTKRAKAPGETLVISYKMPEAIATRDAMAKCLYGALFDWIVMQVNHALLSAKDFREHRGNSIGVLDIFGFEDFGDHNNFEQFCINFANEHLQNYFNQHVFKYEQEEYQKEGIHWKNIEFTDNTGCLSLIEGKPHGLLCLLNDQCNFSGATNAMLLQKFQNQHKNSPFYEVPQKRENAFLVHHYAGRVKYQIKVGRSIGGVKKPLSYKRPDNLVANQGVSSSRRSSFGVSGCQGNLGATSCPVHRGDIHLCANEARVMERANQIMMKNRHTRSRSRMDKGLKNLQSVKTVVGKTHPHPQQRTGRKQPPTVTAQFQVSLSHLMEALSQANPFFVRCIKSNADKIPCSFDEKVILQQLRYTGMLETVRIRQSGYSVRLPFEEFIQRYRVLLPRGLISSRSDIRDFLHRVNLDRNNYQMGKTKVFLRESEKLKLDELLHLQILQRIITVQRYVRAWLQRRHFKLLRASVVRLQSMARGYLMRRRLALERSRHEAATVIQHCWRRHRNARWFGQLRCSVTAFQGVCRGHLLRRRSSGGVLEDSENESLASEGGPASPPTSPGRSGSVSVPGRAPHTGGSTFRDQKNLIHMLSTSEASNLPLRGKGSQKVPVRKCLSEIAPDNSFNKQGQEKKRTPSGSGQTNNGTPSNHNTQEDGASGALKEELKGPLHKARKHFKTFIGSKKDKKENRDDTDESGGEDALSPRAEGLCTEPMPGEKRFAAHTIKSVSMRYKGELCAVCENNMSLFINQGSKCTRCKLLFHPKCAHFADKLPCRSNSLGSEPTPPSRSHKQGRGSCGSSQQQHGGSWNVTRTAEFKDPGDVLITDVSELKNLDSFLVKKVGHLSGTGKKRDSTVDVVFKKALKKFKSNLISTYSAAAQDGRLRLRYKDLTDHFLQVVQSVIGQESSQETFPITMAVNAFRGFLDEFRNMYQSESKPKSKGKKRKRKKKPSQIIEHCGHVFSLVVINIPTSCEVCSNSMWLTERGLVCQGCKLTCHKKCYQKVASSCRDAAVREGPLETDPLADLLSLLVPRNQQGRKVFGVPLGRLVSEEVRIPVVVERLITAIEMKGLYVEGIYRKCGITSRLNQLKQDMDDDPEGVDLDSYPIHVLTATLKAFFREMPEPLMTFELYDSYLLATNFQDPEERVQAIFMETKKLPPAHYDLFERLAFHLARVAQHQEFNRMSPESLAIVFAPCILRTNKRLQAQDTLDCVNKQTICVRCIIQEQLKKVQDTLNDIDSLDTAVNTVVSRLSTLRSSRLSLALEPDGGHLPQPMGIRDEEEELLTQQIENLQKEKAMLTTVLPTLQLALSGSDDDLLSTDLDSAAGSLDDVRPYDDPNLAGAAAGQLDPRHHPKTRVSTPLRRLQPRFPPGSDGSAQGLSSSTPDTSVVSLYKPTEVDDEAIMV
ncbi:myosin-IX, putative [Ixodes scapularis]|uniref:Myosin-IX, putative n=1 Tax=Ixodes scapularis TaxID=6945 RepID=B7Q880_IXOSC|nr:myosin-IX, putative [Ixodes scapularis]|eukprot:XP_002412311.1 myosin-IX, putative [Ixodes scapularis]